MLSRADSGVPSESCRRDAEFQSSEERINKMCSWGEVIGAIDIFHGWKINAEENRGIGPVVSA